jgi:hypothetical protein
MGSATTKELWLIITVRRLAAGCSELLKVSVPVNETMAKK